MPVADPNRFPPLDPFFLHIYTFMMPILFLISGLFVHSGLERRGAAGFVASRLRRLGVPFVLFAFPLGPPAFWPEYFQADPKPATPYRIRTFTDDSRPVGPGWFLWVPPVFD